MFGYWVYIGYDWSWFWYLLYDPSVAPPGGKRHQIPRRPSIVGHLISWYSAGFE